MVLHCGHLTLLYSATCVAQPYHIAQNGHLSSIVLPGEITGLVLMFPVLYLSVALVPSGNNAYIFVHAIDIVGLIS